MPQSLTTCHRVEVGPLPEQAALRDGVINRQGLSHHLFRGLHVETPEAARHGRDQAGHVMHLGVVVGETDLGRLEPPDSAHLGSGPSSLLLCFPVGHVQQGVQKGADAVGVQVLGGTTPLGQKPPASP